MIARSPVLPDTRGVREIALAIRSLLAYAAERAGILVVWASSTLPKGAVGRGRVSVDHEDEVEVDA